MFRLTYLAIAACFVTVHAAAQEPASFTKLKYNHPGLVVDLGVGLWAQPLPMDYDGDGDLDLVVATADVPSNGVYFFENAEGSANPVFRPGQRLGDAVHNITVSYVEGTARVLTPGARHPDFGEAALGAAESIAFDLELPFDRTRATQWKEYDYDGDGRLDLVVGVGVWDDYGWDDAYDDQGRWTNGPLHGYVYVARNTGTADTPDYEEPFRVRAGDGLVDVFGAPSPNFEDWDGDGDLDLICGSFLDRLTYFENTGTRTEPRYAEGRPLEHDGAPLRMELQMLQVVAVDWDRDGDADLVVGEEDGRVSWLECTGRVRAGLPEFQSPRYFRQEADGVKVGALATPYGVDWDGDGDEDLIVGDTAGFLSFVENLGGGEPPRWAGPVRLRAGDETIRIQAGPNGSIQGPAEAKWGYTVPAVADWNHDGLLDIVINSIWGKVLWYENEGGSGAPRLAEAQAVEVAWDGPPPKPAWVWWEPAPNELVTQWRTSPMVRDLDGDGLNDLIMLDHEGYLAFFERVRSDDGLVLRPGQRIFRAADGAALRLNERRAGKSGRRKLAMTDWDGDGRLDLLANSENIDFYRNVAAAPDQYVFEHQGPVSEQRLAGHTTCPTLVDWDGNGIADLLVGAEDGFLYYLRNPRED